MNSLTIECDVANNAIIHIFRKVLPKTFLLKCNELNTNLDHTLLCDARKVVITTEKLDIPFYTHKTTHEFLEYYELNVPRWNEHTEHTKYRATSDKLLYNSKTLKTLILPACPESIDWLTSFEKLDELTIREPLQSTEEKELLDSLQKLKPNLVINYTICCNPEFNQILRLNDDCIFKVFEKIVSIEDFLNVRLAHPRFDEIFTVYAKTAWDGKMSLNSLNGLSTDDKLKIIHLVGHSIKELVAGYTPESEFLAFLPNFPNLLKLEISPAQFCDNHLIRTYPGLQSLSLRSRPNVSYLDGLLRHLSPTLINLRLEYRSFDDDYFYPLSSGFPYTMQFCSLQSIGIPMTMLEYSFVEFWNLNKQLTDLILYPGEEEDCIADVETLGEMTDLRKLFLGDMEEDAAMVFINHFPNLLSLESLTVETSLPDVLRPVLAGIGPQLKTLTIFLNLDGLDYLTLGSDISHLLNLELLEIHLLLYDDQVCDFKYDEKNPINLGCWPILKKMKTLKLSLNSEPYVLQMIEAMPNLEEVVHGDMDTTEAFLEYLRDFLKAKKRTLRYNKSKLDIVSFLKI